MSELLDGLNPSQREAVMHETGPLLIIAGPGSGKTRTVVHSIAYAIENGVMPEQILAFSFTVKASEELRNQVKEIVGKDKGHLINISTFHGFCRQVLREDIDELGNGYAQDFKGLKENDQIKIVKDLTRVEQQRVRVEVEHIQSHEFPNPGEILDFIRKCKAREISPLNAAPHAPDLHMSEVYVEIYNVMSSVFSLRDGLITRVSSFSLMNFFARCLKLRQNGRISLNLFSLMNTKTLTLFNIEL